MGWLRRLGLGMALALLAGACSSESGSGSAGGDESTESAEDVWADFESPLSEFLGESWSGGDEAEMEAEWAEQERQVGVKVTECMANEGFEYVHPDYGTSFTVFDGGEDDLEWGSREWVEKYGYGVTTQAFAESQVAPEAVGYPDSMDESMGEEEFTDPNSEYVGSLSASEQDAYYEALYGKGPEMDESMTEEEMEALYEDYVPTGCYDTAWEEVDGSESEDFYDAFSDELDEMYERIEADPRFVAAQDEVRTCVEGKGLTYISEEDAYDHFGTQIDALFEDVYDNQPEPEMPAGFDDMTIEEQEAWYAENEQFFAEPELSAGQKARLAEMQAEEIEIAVASYDCGGSWVQQAQLYQEILVEYETEFLETHADELEQYKAAE